MIHGVSMTQIIDDWLAEVGTTHIKDAVPLLKGIATVQEAFNDPETFKGLSYGSGFMWKLIFPEFVEELKQRYAHVQSKRLLALI
jgi:hypothetical protein